MTYDPNKLDLVSYRRSSQPSRSHTKTSEVSDRGERSLHTYLGEEFSKVEATTSTLLAAAKDFHTKLGEIVSVKDFGAVGDGLTDDTAAFTAADGLVYVPDGSYKLNSAPTIGTSAFFISPNASFSGNGISNGLGQAGYGFLDTSRGFWTDSPTGASVWRFERVLVGAAQRQSGAWNLGNNKSWVGYEASGYMTYFDAVSTLQVSSAVGQVAIAASTKTSDRAGTLGSSVGAGIGVASYARADAASAPAWAYYGATVRDSGAGPVITAEFDIANAGAAVEQNPYLLGSSGLSAAAWFRSGGEYTEAGGSANDASVALGIVNNEASTAKPRFLAGIVTSATALRGDGRTPNAGIALWMAKGHEVRWSFDQSVTALGGSIRSDATAQSLRQVFGNSSIDWRNASEEKLFEVVANGASNNYWQVLPNTGASGPELRVLGSSTDIPAVIRAKGTADIIFVGALLRLPNASAAAITPSAFTADRIIYVRQSDGTSLAIPCRTTGW